MISFVKKPQPQQPPEHIDDNRFEQIRKAAAERHRKADTDGTRRRPPEGPGQQVDLRCTCALLEKAASDAIS